MARVKFGAVVTDMRGKLGGHLFQASGNTRVMRTNRKSRVVKTQFNGLQERYLNRARLAWATDTSDAKKKNWFDVAPSYFKKNAFGDKIAYTGRGLFLARFMATQQAGFSGPPDPTDQESFIPAPSLASVNIDVANSDITITLGSPNILYRYAIYFWKANSLDQKVSFKNFNLFYNDNETLSNDTVAFAALESAMGTVLVTDIIFFAVVATRINGFKNAPIIRRAIQV